ncbi:hypothetical protein PENFLA_c001G04989 [Penicillium flavigenum]|uniref:Uncharacterized protein n=1 Tax=Penicillium flavigenum TaxID=254877 RepID=A0A1V6U201_9EURO|nr:hypothetical protein PENFLA_c001G04989 [Penicillium flavigenum]
MEAADQTRASSGPWALFASFAEGHVWLFLAVLSLRPVWCSSHLHDLSPWLHESTTEGRTHVAEPKHAETTTKHNTADSEQSNAQAQFQDAAPGHSNVINRRIQINGLLVGFPFQPSSICEECHDSNHDDKNDHEDKHHPTVPTVLIAAMLPEWWEVESEFLSHGSVAGQAMDASRLVKHSLTSHTSLCQRYFNVMTKESLGQSNNKTEYIDGAGKDTYRHTNERVAEKY